MYSPNQPGATSARSNVIAAEEGRRIHQMVVDVQRQLEDPNTKTVPLPNGARLIVNRTVGGKMIPDTVYIDDNKKVFAIIDDYTGGKRQVQTPVGWDSKSHFRKGRNYIKEPDMQALVNQGYQFLGYIVANRPASLPPGKLQ
jgi:hypothetical protein